MLEQYALLTVIPFIVEGCSSEQGVKTRTGSGSTSKVVFKVPIDAKRFRGHWYKAFDVKLPWHQAKRKCEEMGGYLACIETKAEQDFITKLAEGRYLYLGATDEKRESDWRWINGSPWEFTAWMDGQPNNWGGDENFLATYDDGEWVDVAAKGAGFWMPTGYVCEWEDSL